MWWWTTGPAASYYSRSASREPARRLRSPGTWLTRHWSRKWNGMICRGDRAAEPRGTSPCCRRSVAPRKRARRWSWRWPGSWCCYGAVPRSWRLWVLCSVSRGTPTGMERPPPCGTPGSAGLPSPEKEMKTVCVAQLLQNVKHASPQECLPELPSAPRSADGKCWAYGFQTSRQHWTQKIKERPIKR